MYAPSMQVKSIDPSMLEFLRDTLGGSICWSNAVGTHNNLKSNFPLYAWQANTRQAYAAALLLREFLIVKRAQAECAIAFYEEMPDMPTRNVRLPDEELARREVLWARCSFLNKRGYLQRLGPLSRAGEQPVPDGAS